jgi:hypothetical protein
LTDILSAASPEAFSRSTRITATVRYLVGKFNLPLRWRFEAAAMLSQLGCITLDPELVLAAYAGGDLSAEDQNRFDTHPQAARELLTNIPRLEPIAWIISQQLTSTPLEATHGREEVTADVVMGAKMLRLAVAFDNLTIKGVSPDEAIRKLLEPGSNFEAELVQSLSAIAVQRVDSVLRKISVAELRVGMILQQEIRTRATGMLLAAKGQEITPALLIKLERLGNWGAIEKEILVVAPSVPKSSAASAAKA